MHSIISDELLESIIRRTKFNKGPDAGRFLNECAVSAEVARSILVVLVVYVASCGTCLIWPLLACAPFNKVQARRWRRRTGSASAGGHAGAPPPNRLPIQEPEPLMKERVCLRPSPRCSSQRPVT